MFEAIRSLFRANRSKNPGPAARKAQAVRLMAEVLEDRSVPALLTFPSIDGSGHNTAHPDWGTADSDFLRIGPVAYADGISSPSGASRPSAREISNTLNASPEGNIASSNDLSAFTYIWGQFIDHDLDLTNTDAVVTAFNIAVPKGDPYFDPTGTGTQTIGLSRSEYDPATGTSKANPRQQINSTTAWIDGSMIYGSDTATALSLRTLQGGKMKMGEGDMLPIDPATGQVLAGDPRTSENPGLLTLSVLFVKEHNRLADQIAKSTPGLSDEQIYQKARLMVIGEIQAITYNEFLPALLGPGAVKGYAGYKPQVNPGIANEFATAAYRVGHTMVTDDIELLDANGNPMADSVSLRDAFFDTSIVSENGIEPILKYLASDRSNEIDLKVIDDLRNFLFGPPGSGGFDLASLNIQRGRDHGLADYNSVRAAYGLPKVTSFDQITSNKEVQSALKSLYGNVNNIDLWVGGLAENHIKGSSMGATFTKIVADQFQRLRDGDRFWYQNVFSGRDLAQLNQLHLSDIIRQNSDLTNIQDNVFLFKASITGSVFADTNKDGIRNGPEKPLAGRRVELLDDSGAVIASVLTKADGSYQFDHLDLGTYIVRERLADGAQATTQPISITLTRGQQFSQINLGEAVNAPPPSRPVPPSAPPPPKAPTNPASPARPLAVGTIVDILLPPPGKKPI